MKKTRLVLRRESLQQLSGDRLRDIHGGIQTTSDSCATCGCPPYSATACSDACSASVSTAARLGINYPC